MRIAILKSLGILFMISFLKQFLYGVKYNILYFNILLHVSLVMTVAVFTTFFLQ